MSRPDPLVAVWTLLRPRLPRVLLAVAFGVLSLGSALALAGVSAWLITRAWQMPPVLHLTVAVVAVRALGISRGVLGYCERLASHDTALRAAGTAREQLFTRLARGPVDAVMRRHSGELVARVGADVDELSDVLVRAVVPICVAAVLGVGRRRGHRGHLRLRPPRCSRCACWCRGVLAPAAGRPGRSQPLKQLPRASFAARHRGDARARARPGTARQRPARRSHRRGRRRATPMGARHRPGRRAGGIGVGGSDRRDRGQRARRGGGGIALAPTRRADHRSRC